MTEDEMVGWYHRLNGHEFEQALGVGDGQGSLHGTGAASVGCTAWSGREEIPHVQGQRNPSKMAGSGVTVSRYPHAQGQRRSPSKMVGGANSRLEPNPILTRRW